MEAGLVGVSKHVLRNFLHEDNTKTPVAAPEARLALEFDRNEDSPCVLLVWRLALTSRETGLELS